MAALAGLLHESGARVTGSDHALYPPTSTILAAMGIEVFEGFDAAHLTPRPDLVVIGNAVRRGNPEAEEVLDHDLPYGSMPALLGERFLGSRHSIVVAGTHGKTTTSAMLAFVLDRAGRDPGFLIGGLPSDFERPYRLGGGAAFVIEGDEYDTAFFDKGPKFLHYRPDTVLLGAVEFDHADIYRDLEEVKRAFRWLVNIVPRRGLVVRYEDAEITREVSAKALSRVEGYGERAGLWRARDLTDGPEGLRFRVERDGALFLEASMRISGAYNARNALAVVAAAAEQGLSAEEIAGGLAAFGGVRRRLDVKGEAGGIVVVDDFAHHPTAIDATLRAVRARWPGRRIVAVLEPRSWSLRRNVFQERLAESFAVADEAIIASVYGAEELPVAERLDTERLVRDLSARGVPARCLDGVDAIVATLGREANAGDLIAVLSNGGFGGIHAKLLEAFAARESAA
jgi:UDP-N-acetylmuramate: L-alanyl-gamma-D-glutamyl-meso-diaminopimelate ligase